MKEEFLSGVGNIFTVFICACGFNSVQVAKVVVVIGTSLSDDGMCVGFFDNFLLVGIGFFC